MQAGDCDDTAALVHPGATEVCDDGVDNDCNQLVDDADPSLDLRSGTRFWTDRDGDGYGGTWFSLWACVAPQGMVADDTDCNDDDPAINPGAPEVCNAIDDNCSGKVDDDDPARQGGDTWYSDKDEDGWGAGTDTVQACEAPPGTAPTTRTATTTTSRSTPARPRCATARTTTATA